MVRICRICGCTDDDCSGCVTMTGRPCSWALIDVCSACKPLLEKENSELIEIYNRVQVVLKERGILSK